MVISKDLIQACKRKERVAQQQLYSILLPYLNLICKRYLINTSDTKDALQEAFIKIFSNINQFDSNRGQMKTWAIKITINCALKYNKKMYRFPTKELDVNEEQASDPEILAKLSNDDLLNLVKKMPKNYFVVFNLHVIDGFSHKEISEILGIEESLSRKRLSRARGWLTTKESDFKKNNLGIKKWI